MAEPSNLPFRVKDNHGCPVIWNHQVEEKCFICVELAHVEQNTCLQTTQQISFRHLTKCQYLPLCHPGMRTFPNQTERGPGPFNELLSLLPGP